MTAEVALDRTARLIVADLLDGKVERAEVVRALTGASVRIIADARNLSSAAGQHVLTTLVLQLTMCGIGVELDIPAIALLGHQPPLAGDELKSALESHVRTNLPWVALNTGAVPMATLLVGSTRGKSSSDLTSSSAATRRAVMWAGVTPPRVSRGQENGR